MCSLILFAFTPLSWAFIPGHVDEKGQHHVDGDHSNNSSIEIAVPIGHPKGAYREKESFRFIPTFIKVRKQSILILLAIHLFNSSGN